MKKKQKKQSPELNGATVEGRTPVEQIRTKPEGERRSFNNNRSGGNSGGGYGNR
jgi:hypothetical protein